jgi:hypothetical protein
MADGSALVTQYGQELCRGPNGARHSFGGSPGALIHLPSDFIQQHLDRI